MLTMEQRGILFTAIYSYELGEELPEMDPLTEMCFGFIKSSLDANAEKYESRCEINRENGGKGGRPRNNRTVLEENQKNRMVSKETEWLSEKPNGFQNNRTVLEENQKNRMVSKETEWLSEKPNGFQNNRTVLDENDENPNETIGFSENPIDIDIDSDSEFDSVSESDSRGASERERFFEIFFFMNFQNPLSEVDRFVNHYSANGWCRANSTTPVKDRIALARSWSQANKDAPPRFPPEFLSHWQEVYAEAKKRNADSARIMLTHLEAVEITPHAIRLHCLRRLQDLIEGNRAFFKPQMMDRFYPNRKLFYTSKQ